MLKKLRKIFKILKQFECASNELKTLFDDFEKAYEDKKITLEESIDLLVSIIRIFRKVFPNL